MSHNFEHQLHEMFGFGKELVGGYSVNASSFTAHSAAMGSKSDDLQQPSEKSEAFPFDRFYISSVKNAAITVIGRLYFASLSAYAFARICLVGSNVLSSLILSTLMFPSAISVVVLYIDFWNIGRIDIHYLLLLQ